MKGFPDIGRGLIRSLFPAGKTLKIPVEKNVKKEMKKNLVLSFDSSRNPIVAGDYFKAYREVLKLIRSLDIDEAEKLWQAFSSVRSSDPTYLYKVADFLEEKCNSISLPEISKVREEAINMLADQLVDAFRIYKKEPNTFAEFAEEIKSLYENFAPLAKEIAIKKLSPEEIEEFERGYNKLEKRRRRKKILAIALFLSVLASIPVVGSLYHSDQKKDQEKRVYKEAGLSDEEASRFISKFPNQNGNSTWIYFAKAWKDNPSLAEKSLGTFGNLKDALNYMNSSKNVEFLMMALDNKEILPYYLENPGLVEKVYQQFSKDPRISVDRNALFFEALKKYKELDLLNKNLSVPTIHSVNNLTIAYKQLGLPLDNAAIWLLTNATQIPNYGKDLVDFEPIVIKDVKGNIVTIESKNLTRDYWLIYELLKKKSEIVNQPKKFEWINRMVQQLAWKIFDYEYGPGFFDKKSYRPNDDKVWQVILGFHDYMDNLPNKLQKDNLPIAFHYWDSNLLKQEIADKTNRTVALFYLADIPAKTFDLNSGQIVFGIDAMKKFVEQLPMVYDEIKSLYPNGKVKTLIGDTDPRLWYYSWLTDRQNNGLNNTVYQFIGIKLGEYPDNIFEFVKLVPERNGIDQFLTKNWEAWDLIKFIYGYERFNSGIWGGEWEMYAYGLPLAYKAFGVPLGQMGMKGTSGNLGGPGNYSHGEFAIYGIPDIVVKNLLNSQKELGRIAIGYGNGISMISGIDGVEKDTGYQITHGVRGKEVYLWKK